MRLVGCRGQDGQRACYPCGITLWLCYKKTKNVSKNCYFSNGKWAGQWSKLDIVTWTGWWWIVCMEHVICAQVPQASSKDKVRCWYWFIVAIGLLLPWAPRYSEKLYLVCYPIKSDNAIQEHNQAIYKYNKQSKQKNTRVQTVVFLHCSMTVPEKKSMSIMR